LISKKQIEDRKKLNPLAYACKNDNDYITSLLIEHTDVDKLHVSALFSLCRNKTEKLTIVKQILLKYSTASQEPSSTHDYVQQAMSQQDFNKQTLLHVCIENNHLNIVELLFEKYNCDRFLSDGKQGNLGVHFAAKSGSLKMLNILKQYNAVSSRLNNKEENPLHIAAAHNQFMFIKEFLNIENDSERNFHVDKPSVRVLNKFSMTPLMVAISLNNQDSLKILLDDKNVKLSDKTQNLGTFHFFLTIN